jgi:beta-RFAP synthase
LHFGLFAIGDTVDQKFGGAGLMIADPQTVVTASHAESFEMEGINIDAGRRAIQIWFDNLPSPIMAMLRADRLSDLGANLRIEAVPPRHSGFGSGTQLALSIVMAVTQLFELPTPSPCEMAASVGRGKRSAIGSHGFFRGGFLVDRGITRDDSLAPLDFQAEFPKVWPVVTANLNDVPGLSGQMELSAFQKLPPTSAAAKSELVELVRGKLIPGIMQLNYDLFAEGTYELGRRSGMMYSAIQNGPYNGPQVELLVNKIRDFGIPAVGQSSWGPCVFAIARNDKLAMELAANLRTEYGDRCNVRITRADNRGARIISPKPQTAFEPQ